ncbi:MAG TPA: DUF1127 domain-containing protein [Stellaceae bacterium]|nr:DUF1127 domain-containing protein [Stellaceae bacterium]
MTAIHLQSRHDIVGTRDHGRAALSEAAGRVFATVREWRRRSRDRAQLAALDARTLADIGLTPGDAQFLANKPFWKE